MLSTRNSQRNNLWAHCNKAFLTIHKIFTLFSLNIASCCRDVEMTYTERIYTGVYYVYTDIKIVTYSKLEVCSCNLCYMLYIAPIYLYFPAHMYISVVRDETFQMKLLHHWKMCLTPIYQFPNLVSRPLFFYNHWQNEL